jgi:putative transposase
MSLASFIVSQRIEDRVPHAVACRALDVSESWFYKWRDRPPTPAEQRRAALDAKVHEIFEDSGGEPGTYGSPRIHAELRELGWKVTEKTVAASMARQGLVARPKKRFRCLTQPDKRAVLFADLVKRDFSAPAPNVKWSKASGGCGAG